MRLRPLLIPFQRNQNRDGEVHTIKSFAGEVKARALGNVKLIRRINMYVKSHTGFSCSSFMKDAIFDIDLGQDQSSLVLSQHTLSNP